MNELFPSDWREHVRVYLTPLQSSDEQAHYRVGVSIFTETAKRGAWGTFYLGNATLNYLATPQYGVEESQQIIWATQTDFVTPLSFWAATEILKPILLLSADDPIFKTGLINSVFDFNAQPQAQLLPTLPDPTLQQLLIEYNWPEDILPTPPVLDDSLLSGWQLSQEWCDDWVLYRTESLHCLWNWTTMA